MDNISQLIHQALEEDVKDGDHTSLACIPKEAISKAKLLVKDTGILAGVDIAKKVFELVDDSLTVEVLMNDGDPIKEGDIVFYVSGKSQSILKGERLALNYMQRMSGIATHTAELNQLISGTNAKLLDTRKTTPNNRAFEKLAVKIGGGVNHRFGLYDMVMIKDNHIDYAGGIQNAIDKTYLYLAKNNLNLKVEVEARNIKEVETILSCKKVDRIMLDNFNYEDMRTAVKLIDNQAETEASGGITKDTIREYALCGVDYISVGALTHQINSLDLSLKAVE